MVKKFMHFMIVVYKALKMNVRLSCRYYPSCSAYAQEALKHYPLSEALWIILKRITSCHPWSKRPQVDFLQKKKERA